MSEYIVSARKYRPMTFDTVVGQGSIATTLKNAIRVGKLAHAYLFCGPRGVGKTTCARIFAKTINCLNPREDGEACNECESCQAFNEQRSLNIHELDAASNNSVDDIRNLIDQVRIPPQIGKYKVFIIDEVHMLSTAAFNAFLKTLEEPPAHAIFILATTEKHKILPTILSRCQIYDFQRMTIDNMVQHLAHVAQQEGYSYEPTALHVIAQKADGGMRDALSIFDQVVSYTGGNITYQHVIENLNVLDYDYYFRLVDFMLEKKVSESLLLYNEVLAKGFEGGPFISGLASHLRDLLVSKDPQTTQLLEVSDDLRQRYAEQASRCRVQWLYQAIRLCNSCDQAYRTSRNKRLQVELTLIECTQATDDEPGAGRRPVRILKPIFSHLAAAAGVAGSAVAAPSVAAVSPAAGSPVGIPPATGSPAAGSPVGIPPATSSPAAGSPVGVPPATGSPAATATAVPPATGSPTTTATALPSNSASVATVPGVSPPGTPPTPPAKLKTLKLSGLAPSIRGLSTSTANPSPVGAGSLSGDNSKPSPLPNKAEDEGGPALSLPVTQEGLTLQWQAFINTMPQEETALAQRMRIMQPRLTSEGATTAEVTAENEEVATMLVALKPRLLPFLRQQLQNVEVDIIVAVAEQSVQPQRTYDKRQQLRHLCNLNPSLITLGKTFKLELT